MCGKTALNVNSTIRSNQLRRGENRFANAHDSTRAFDLILTRTVLEMIWNLGRLYATILLTHTINDSAPTSPAAGQVEATIRRLVQVWGRMSTRKVEEMALAAMPSIGRLRSFDRAVREGRFPEAAPARKTIYQLTPETIHERLQALSQSREL